MRTSGPDEPSRLPFVSRLPLGSFVANSGELVTRGRAVLDVARTLCDVVIVEVPPLLAVHHAEALAHATDVVLVVGECGVTSFNDARRAGDLLRRIDAPVLGVVLTNVRIDQKDVRLTVPHRFVRSAPADPEPAAEREAVLALGPGPATFSGSSPGSYSDLGRGLSAPWCSRPRSNPNRSSPWWWRQPCSAWDGW